MYIYKRTHKRQNRNRRRQRPIYAARRKTAQANSVPTIEQVIPPPQKVVVVAESNGEVQFTNSIMNILQKNNLKPSDLVGMSDEEILAIKGIGSGKLNTIRTVLNG